jgi:SAM-dependent methyltransferase
LGRRASPSRIDMRWSKERLCLCVETIILLCVAVEYFSWQLPSLSVLHISPARDDGTAAETANTRFDGGKEAAPIPSSLSSPSREPEQRASVTNPVPTSSPVLTKYQADHVATCANGSIFTRQMLTGQARVVVVKQNPSAPVASIEEQPFPQKSFFTRHGKGGLRAADMEHCIGERLSRCELSLTAPMSDLLPNGSFDGTRLSVKYTGENAMHDTTVYRRYFIGLSCVVVYKPAEDHYSHASSWEERAGPLWNFHPVLNPLHGKVSPSRLIKQARYLLGVAGAKEVLDVLQAGFNEVPLSGAEKLMEGKNYLMVEFGCGHGALLASMCPPVKGIRCYGSDFSAKLIDVGKKHFPWLHLEPSTKAPAVPNGWADLALSHAVMIYLKEDALCNHVLEGLRVLRPGGKLVLWMLWLTPFGAGTRIHPSFFVSGVQWNNVTTAGYTVSSTSSEYMFLPYCSDGIGELVDRVELWLADEGASIYAPRLNRGGPYGAVLRRSGAFHSSSGPHKLLSSFSSMLKNQSSIESWPSSPTSGSALSLYTDYFSRWRGYSALNRFDKMKGKWV